MLKILKMVVAIIVVTLTVGCGTLPPQANNVLMGSAIGAAFGAATGDTSKAAKRGAVIGGIFGLLMPVNQQPGQQVAYGGQNGNSGCVNATVDGRAGCYDPRYLQTLQQNGQNGQQLQQGNSCGNGGVQATVDGRAGCYSPQYLQTLQRNGQNSQQLQQGQGSRCPLKYTQGVGWVSCQ